MTTPARAQSGRIIPMHTELRSALDDLHSASRPGSDDFVMGTERSKQTSPQVIVNLFARWYEVLGFSGCSSRSGVRTFITNAARKISTVDGSLRDVHVGWSHEPENYTKVHRTQCIGTSEGHSVDLGFVSLPDELAVALAVITFAYLTVTEIAKALRVFRFALVTRRSASKVAVRR